MSYIAEIILNLSSFSNLVKTSLAFKHSTLKAMQRKFKMVTSQKKIGYKLIYPIQVME